MMDKIINIKEAVKLTQQYKQQKRKIVLCGGVFDILHEGHKEFLKNAKDQGDILFVFVESDEKVRETKGHSRPVNLQGIRAENLAKIEYVSYVIPLPYMKINDDYDSLVAQIKPDIIATTRPDPFIFHKKRQAEQVGAKVVEVIDRIPNTSTTDLIKK